MQPIYLDNNATTQPHPDVIQAMQDTQTNCWGNPSSLHRFGQSARQRLEIARAQVANLLDCLPKHLIFTSGGTESNALALQGTFDTATPQQPKILITTQIEHAAIRETAAALEKQNVKIINLPLEQGGYLPPQTLKSTLETHAKDNALILVSLIWVNNETGLINDIPEMANIVQEVRDQVGQAATIRLHSDATQAVGKLKISCTQSQVDLLTFAAHKFHGPKGIGGLYLRPGIRIKPRQLGGPQEHEKRGGTENVPAIIGLGIAATLANDFLNSAQALQNQENLRDHFEAQILNFIDLASINQSNHPQAKRIWNTTNIAFKHLEAEAILLSLSEKSIYASAGAACSSGSLEPSPVLLAMGIDPEHAHGSIRFSLSRLTTQQQIDQAIPIITTLINKLAKTLPL